MDVTAEEPTAQTEHYKVETGVDFKSRAQVDKKKKKKIFLRTKG